MSSERRRDEQNIEHTLIIPRRLRDSGESRYTRRMDESTRHLIQAIHDSPPRGVFAAAGAGSRALADLLGVPGASRTLLEALIPYAADSFDEFLGLRPEQYVSEETGRRMAGRALARARHLRELEAVSYTHLDVYKRQG